MSRQALLDESLRGSKRPDFKKLLSSPTLDTPLPKDFRASEEAEHLASLWQGCPRLQNYEYEAFVHAGGSGMVFKVYRDTADVPMAMKVARRKLFDVKDMSTEAASSLSPVSENELRALESISHPHVVRLYEAIENEKGVIAVCTSYVDKPVSLDSFFRTVLSKRPPRAKGFSHERLDRACEFLADRSLEVADALQHMHEKGIVHFDVKPANILIASDNRAVLTDMGACVHADRLSSGKGLRVHFTWTYAHPDLRDLIRQPGSISGGGLKASANVAAGELLAKYDLFALGKTMQEVLAVLEFEFRERCNASYGYRFLHLVSCLLLDGRNASGDTTKIADARRFVSDVALGYPPKLFEMHKLSSASDLVERLRRFGREYSWNANVPELDSWQPDIINSVAHSPAPFTERVNAVLNHPAFRRLKDEQHLGWMREVFPGATHDRWTHSLGVFSAVAGYYAALLSDPEIPTFRILVGDNDILSALLASILHDLCQTAFGHDLEEVSSAFAQDKYVRRLLDEEEWGEPTLRSMIAEHWRGLDIERVLAIPALRKRARSGRRVEGQVDRAVDGVAHDAIDGPIDADKLDYLIRDSIACGVPYGHGIDVVRFMRALTTTCRSEPASGTWLALAYKAKGRAAITSLLLARYQMYGAVYWQHTYRSIHAMFVHAAYCTFGRITTTRKKLRNTFLTARMVETLFYNRVICRKTWDKATDAVRKLTRNQEFTVERDETPPPLVAREPSLDFLWTFADDSMRRLVEGIASRHLYRRIYELRVGELGERADYYRVARALPLAERVRLAAVLQKAFLDKVLNLMRERGATESLSEEEALKCHRKLGECPQPLVIVDFPTRGVPTEVNTPAEIGDPMRKYSDIPVQGVVDTDSVFHVVRKMQEHLATLRVFAKRELHDLVMRYMNPDEIRACVEDTIPDVRKT